MTIHEIILHRDYRNFAAWATEHGMQVLPDGYPWRFMGVSDEKFLSTPLKTCLGDLIEGEAKLGQLGFIRAQERLVEMYWDQWQAQQQVKGLPPRPAVAQVAQPVTPYEQESWLF